MTTPDQQEWPTFHEVTGDTYVYRETRCDRVCPDHNRVCRGARLHDGVPHACLLCGTQEAPPKE